MISFESLSLNDLSPIYMQIIMHIKRGIASGNIKDGDELPSRRVLSSALGVNPNTVQKAYKLLEEEGLIESRLGAKSCMLLDEEKIRRISDELTESDIKAVVLSMKQMGISKEKAIDLISKYWE